jgi:hypothetical protein
MLRLLLGALIGATVTFCATTPSLAQTQAPATAPAPAAEMVTSPQYTSWARHKPGTTVTMKSDVNTGGMAMTMDLTQTLKEVTPDKAVVDVAMKMNMGNMAPPESKQTNEIAAKVAKGHEVIPPDFKGTARQVANETLQIGGKSYDCVVYEIAGESEEGKSTGKIWHTTEIPGGMAKMQVKIEGQAPTAMTMNVVSVDAK